jgi:hypothetical protein
MTVHRLRVHTLLNIYVRCACADVDVLNQVARGGAGRTWAGRRVHRGCAAQRACPWGRLLLPPPAPAIALNSHAP